MEASFFMGILIFLFSTFPIGVYYKFHFCSQPFYLILDKNYYLVSIKF